MAKAGRLAHAAACLLAAALAACSTPAFAPSPLAPEAASGWSARPALHGGRNAVAAAHPAAVDAGRAVLARGGSAVDAAIAVQLVLTLVEPQSSGIGGGAFLVIQDGPVLAAYDGRETAPAAATESQFLQADGLPMPWRRASLSGRSVGVPGALAMLELAHRRHGRLPWAQLFEPAIELAERGFPVSARLHESLLQDTSLRSDPIAGPYFHGPDGRPWPIGHVLRNPELAAVLRVLAARGAGALASEDIGTAIVGAVRRPPDAGSMTLDDLRGYRPQQREPLCFLHRADRELRVCGMPPPSAGTLVVGQVLGLLQRRNARALPLQDGLPDAAWLHLDAEATRLAHADRDAYVADPDFVPAPAGRWDSLLAARYLDRRATLVGERAATSVEAGQPAGATTAFAPMREQPEHGTSHVSIADARGQVVALTTTIEAGFGSHRMVNRGRGLAGGFLLNNQLTDFSFAPRDAAGRPIANRVQPGKRPRSSMAPTIVMDAATGAPVLVLGSPGGTLIPSFVIDTLWGVLHWRLDPVAAVALPHSAPAGQRLLLEDGRFPASTASALAARGHRPEQAALTSGVHLLAREPDGRWSGAADPRREGMAAGD